MVDGEIQRRSVHILNADVARKIAAGEVVDRPAALVRELIDNALDAEAHSIEVQIEGGGARRTEVIDDGIGMTREDLALCWLPHATSKVESLEDLLSAETLGFRGEALAATTAVAQVEILSSTDGREAWLLSVGPGGFDRLAETPEQCISQARRVRGTTVRVLGLFDSVPARKKFLKRDGTEALQCRQVFIDKALAFPDRAFRFVQEGDLKLFFPPAANYRERFIQAQCEGAEKNFIHEIYAQGEGFTVTMVIGGPELYRQDRRQQFVFANGRRIQDFALLQALEYGLQGAFPNGTHPVGALFITIDPALADFNIHPAKREVRFKEPAALHHAITAGLRQFMRTLLLKEQNKSAMEAGTLAERAAEDQKFTQTELGELGRLARRSDRKDFGPPLNPDRTQERNKPSESSRLALEALLEHPPEYRELPRHAPTVEAKTDQRAVLIGRLFTLFLLAEAGDMLYIIDQHAAHERILYDKLSERPVQKQELLIPIPFETDSENADRFLQVHQKDLEDLGIVLEAQGQGHWNITALPANWKKGDAETIQDILELEKAGEFFGDRWLATMACHMAIKDGDFIDDISAQALVEAALALPVPRCPHGRPIWTSLSRNELFQAVRRTG